MRLSLNSDKYVLRGSKIRPCSKTQGFFESQFKNIRAPRINYICKLCWVEVKKRKYTMVQCVYYV